MNETTLTKVLEALRDWAHHRGEYTLRDVIHKCLESKDDRKKSEKKDEKKK